MRTAIIIGILMLSVKTRCQDTLRTYALGDTLVKLVVHRSNKPGPLYFNMHDDEHTSVEAASAVLDSTGGELYELSHNGNRYIEFHRDGKRYAIDPNRIYTEAGTWREVRRSFDQDSLAAADSLHRIHWKWVKTCTTLWIEDTQIAKDSLTRAITAVLDAWRIPEILPAFRMTARDTQTFVLIRNFAEGLLSEMDIRNRKLVVALHNNKELGYSMLSYMVDSIYGTDALALYRGWNPDADDFYFVTDRHIFEALQPTLYHIVLQDNSRVTDDGSLSVYCGLRHIPYVNIEAQHGHLTEQRQMLKHLTERVAGLIKF